MYLQSMLTLPLSDIIKHFIIIFSCLQASLPFSHPFSWWFWAQGRIKWHEIFPIILTKKNTSVILDWIAKVWFSSYLDFIWSRTAYLDCRRWSITKNTRNNFITRSTDKQMPLLHTLQFTQGNFNIHLYQSRSWIRRAQGYVFNLKYLLIFQNTHFSECQQNNVKAISAEENAIL